MLPNVVLFEGLDSSGHSGLWETDGTTAGTFEITGIAATFSTGLYPANLTPLNANEVVFNGTNKSGLAGLWVTDGTAAGTHELTGIAGVAKTGAGLYPSDLTAYNGKALFSGADASGAIGLWVTDGTAAGTHELNVAGALTKPAAGGLPAGLSPSNLTVYNGEVFFGGDNTNGEVGLWETDGSASGTHELAGIAGVATVGQDTGPPGLFPDDLTVYNGQLLFSGDDAQGQTGLWESNGTASGTHELNGIVGAPTSGKGLDPSYLTVFNGQAFFNGRASSGDLGLWVTDGTAAGTHELTGVAGAAAAGLDPVGLTVLNGQMLFAGRDLGGQFGLWETDGTVAGTHELTGISGAQTTSTGLAPSNLTVYNGQVLFRGRDSSGKLGLWETNGTAAGTHELTGVVGASTAGLAPVGLTATATGPGLTAGGAVSYVAGATAIALDAGLSVSDAESVNLTAATITISAGFLAGDTLSVGAPQTGITSAYNAATGVLTLSGPASLAAYQKELDSVAYASPHAAASSRTITWSVNDGVNTSAAATSTVSVSGRPPTLTAGASVGYVAGATPVALDVGLSVTDAVAVSLSAATVTISTGFIQGDALSVGSPQTGITSAYNAATGVLTLSGAASLAAYQKELDSVAYASPHATASSRTITWSVNDGVNTSAAATSHVAVSRLPPGLTAGASVSYVAGATPLTLDAALSITDAAAVSLSAATVTISAGFVQGDALSVGSSQTGITSAYNAATGVLTLSGAASLAAYQKELDSVAYASAHATASSRTITWSVNDGVNTSSAATSHVAVSRLPPGLSAGASVSYVAGATPLTLDAGLSVSDAAAVSLSAATVSISAGFLAGDALSVGSPQTGITSAYNAATGVLTLSGAASLAAYQKELDSVAYASPHATTSSRTITWSVNDGVNTSAAASSHVSVGVLPSAPSDPSPNPGPDLNIMLQNTGGQLALWQVNGSTLSAADLLGPNPGASWSEKGVGAFFTGDTSDILLQNANGQISIWEMDGNKLIGGGPVSSNPGPSWKAIGAGDFNDDGHSDILFQNTGSGQVSIWEMNGNTLIGGGGVSLNPGPAWKAIGTGDFNDDGHSDILFQNTTSGQVSIWEMNENKLIGGGPVSPNPGPAWKVIGTGDFNDDGHSDILFQNKSSGQVSIWEMDGNKLIGGGQVSPNPGPSWNAIGTDGGSDILFQNTGGQISIWDMTGTHLAGGGAVSPNPGPNWHGIGLA